MDEKNIMVMQNTGKAVGALPVEIVERKGIGHPDSICDGIAERISQEYCRWCEEQLGILLHHNFDKVQLVAGEVEVDFGSGQVIKPIRIQIAGRGTPAFRGKKVPMDRIAIEAARAYLSETMRYLDPVAHVCIDCYAGRGAGELVSAVDHVEANDTSFGVSHWPRSGLETIVYETANYINQTLIDSFPIGEDIKVMGYRLNDAVTLTVAVPLIAEHIGTAKEYNEVKDELQSVIHFFARDRVPRYAVQVAVNTADKPERGDFYLSVTGTSAECGDDGAVGRGNRVNGVIAPFRSASLEAACGKNPISHVGKLYNALAFLAARDIVAQVPGVLEVTLYILSQIGQPLNQPLVAAALVRPNDGGLTQALQSDVRAVLDRHLANVSEVGARIRRGELSLF